MTVGLQLERVRGGQLEARLGHAAGGGEIVFAELR